MARPGPLHAGGRSGRKSRLPQGRSHRSAGSEAGHRQPPGANLLSGVIPHSAMSETSSNCSKTITPARKQVRLSSLTYNAFLSCRCHGVINEAVCWDYLVGMTLEAIHVAQVPESGWPHPLPFAFQGAHRLAASQRWASFTFYLLPFAFQQTLGNPSPRAGASGNETRVASVRNPKSKIE